jgi:hypothetical protein
MTSIPANKTTTIGKPIAARRNWKAILVFTFAKLGENINDMIVTIAAVSMLLAYLLITNPVAAINYGGYIIAVYMLILFRRIVQDFDDSYTNDEIGQRVDLMLDILKEVYRRQRAEGTLSDSDFEERLNSIL